METYKILQFHLHAPAEHTIDGKYYELELHIVHANAVTGKLAVVGIFFDHLEGGNKANDFITSLQIGTPNAFAPTIPLMTLMKQATENKSFYQYQGSLTTPHCDEIVTFNILKEPQHISEAQIALFNAKWKDNSHFANGNGNNRAI